MDVEFQWKNLIGNHCYMKEVDDDKYSRVGERMISGGEINSVILIQEATKASRMNKIYSREN